MNAQGSQTSQRHSMDLTSSPRYYIGTDDDSEIGVLSNSQEIFGEGYLDAVSSNTGIDKEERLDQDYWFPSKDQAPDCIRSSLDLFHHPSSHHPESVVQRTFSVATMPSQSVSNEEDFRMQEIQSRERLGAIIVYSSLEELKVYV